jgi:Flp pilus assembly protein TadD
MDRWSPVLSIRAGCVVLLAGLLYLNALWNPFVYDDYRLIVENTSILNLRDLPGIVYPYMTRPLVNLSYAVDAAVWGRQPFGFHLTSVLLHMLNVGLVLCIGWLLAQDRRRQRDQRLPATASPAVIATATATLFAAHPLMTQAVGYISGRSEVLYAALFLLAFVSARQWMLHGGKRWWLLTVGLWVLSLLAKETGVMLGFVLLFYDRFILDGDAEEKRRRLLTLHLPLLSIALLAGVVRVAVLTEVEYPGEPQGDWRFALVAFDVFWRYLGLVVAPQDQSIFHEVPAIEYPVSIRAIAAVAGLAGLLWAAWRLRRVHSVVAFGVVWFFLLLVPSGVLFALGRGEPMAEHRVYGASIGMFLAAGSAFGMLWRRLEHRGPAWRWLLYGLSTLFVVQLCGRTIVRNQIWSDPVRLSGEAVAMSPDHWMPRLLLGEALRTSGRCDEAVAEYRKAIALRPQGEFGYSKLAACLIAMGRLDEATAAFEQLEAVSPQSSEASTGLGLLAVLRNRPAEGREHFVRTLERSPSDPHARQLLAFVDGALAPEEAIAVCSELGRLVSTFASEACDPTKRP